MDLTQSDAKIARARVHLESLEGEIASIVNQRKPYTAQVSDIDPETGWCSVDLVADYFSEIRLGVIVGDIVHNLRSALDYIVVSLVEKSPPTIVGPKHQFPIYLRSDDYIRDIDNGIGPNRIGRGNLKGILHGLDLIESFQPYNRKPDPRGDPLFQLNRFSNADKHRVISQSMWFLGGGKGDLVPDAPCTVLQAIRSNPALGWEPDLRYEILRVQYAKPYPTKLHFEANITVRPVFFTPEFGPEAGNGIFADSLGIMCKHVTDVTDAFKAL